MNSFYCSCKIKGIVSVTFGETEYELIPCVRISNGVVGYYDSVEKVFYMNQGTGSFSKGGYV